ncbi:MAG: hypothetical protein NPIRA05_00730 [Nitrospirales bacterium]|nr:MAG: hypothetical protein NPIRA05_00730 [Nitrospirales bacterium]
MSDFETDLDHIRQSPQNDGLLHMIVRRPEKGTREVLTSGALDVTAGLVGDNWKIRGSSRTKNGLAHPHTQITIMNSRVIALVAGNQHRWPLAGNQLYVDFDLSVDNVPPGTQLALGTAIIEVTDQPLTGCKKFSTRFGLEAVKLVNSPIGKILQLRGINTKVVRSGTIRTGNIVKKMQRIH